MEMNRKRLARIAYIAASDRLLAACDAGTLSREAGRAKLGALRRAYDKRISDIELEAFFEANGLGFVAEMGKLDAPLAKMAAEHEAGTVGTTPVVAMALTMATIMGRQAAHLDAAA